MKNFVIETYNQYNLPDRAKTSICPLCSHDRKKKTEKCAMLDWETGIGTCQHCNKTFQIHKYKRNFKADKNYKKPNEYNKKIDDNTIKYFKNRCISENVLNILRISNALEYMPQENKEMNCILFNYYRDNELVNIKYRDGKKNFKLYKDAELIFYNFDSLLVSEEIIITEGEIDCLSYIECGILNVVSVPNGANVNLQYLDSCIDLFDNIKKIYIASDNDEPGKKLQKELIRRLGFEKCYLVDFLDCKDANSYLVKYGKEALKETIKNAKEIIMEGVLQVRDFETELDNLYLEGLKPGLFTRHNNLNDLISFETSRLAVGTGIPGHGKSEFIDELCVDLSILHNWKIAYFSPENFPIQLHGSKIIEKLTGKKYNSESLSIELQYEAKRYLNENFFFIKPKDENYSLDNILEKAKYLIKKKGIKVFVLDPYNRLEYQIEKNLSQTELISKQLDKMINFLQTYDILFILIAHPFKMKKENGRFEIPNLYSINGSANFYNKCDYGFTIYRDYENEEIQVHVQKVKFKHLGKPGLALFKYNINNGRFQEISASKCPVMSWNNDNFINFDKKEEKINEF